MTDDQTTGARRWPAEWEPHEATWLTWPHNPQTWPGKFEPVAEKMSAFVHALASHEPVRLLATNEVRAKAERWLQGTPNIEWFEIPTNDSWIRDYGPTFVQATDQLVAVDWQYNAWGGKYPPWDLDAAVAARIAQALGIAHDPVPIVMEGGAIEGNGAGTMLASRDCLLAKSRNPGRSAQDLEHLFQQHCGTRKVIWVAGDLIGDDTDGHVDQLARFVSQDTVLVAQCKDPTDPNYASLRSLWEQLDGATDADGQPLQLQPLWLPRPKYYQGHRLPASYCNFYIANGIVCVPQFGDPHDSWALDLLGQAFPERQICGLDALDIVWGLGAFHCLSQQQPRRG